MKKLISVADVTTLNVSITSKNGYAQQLEDALIQLKTVFN
jgi:hypothetical protein